MRAALTSPAHRYSARRAQLSLLPLPAQCSPSPRAPRGERVAEGRVRGAFRVTIQNHRAKAQLHHRRMLL